MKHVRRTLRAWSLWMAAGLWSLMTGWFGAAWAQQAQPLPPEFMPSSQVRPGMTGEGRTVFKGYEVGTFKVEILGVDHNASAGGNMILARVDGPMLENHGPVAGMSGSPIYIDGKIIGALSSGWTFAYHPYCGITPIEDMWTVWNNIDQPGLSEHDHAPGTPADDSQAAAWDWQAAWDDYRELQTAQPEPAKGYRPSLPALAGLEGEMRPLSTPLFVSGASGPTYEKMQRFFAASGLELMSAGTMAGSGGGASLEPAPAMQPGSSLGVPLLSGDLALSGVGTVTWCQGDRLIGFGHPMFFSGASKVPMAHAYIYGFMQSYARSFKLGEVGEVVGTIRQDRQYAIGGTFDQGPARVPVHVRVGGPAASRPRDYHFSSWDHPRYLPFLVSIAAEESYIGSGSPSGKLTARTRYQIELADGRTIAKEHVTSSQGFVVGAATEELMFDLFVLKNNIYREAEVKSVDVQMEVSPGLTSRQLAQLRPQYNQYEPGQTVRLEATYRAWRSEESTQTFEVPLPGDLRPGVYAIMVADAQGRLNTESLLRPAMFRPRTFDQIVTMTQATAGPENILTLYLLDPASQGLSVQDQVLGDLPSSVADVLKSTADPDRMALAGVKMLWRGEVPFGYPVQGTASASIQVVDRLPR